jgi:hypothetical protein
MANQSDIYRLRAISAEQRAKQSADASIKKEWDDLAIQWHLIANVVGANKAHEIDVV